MAFKIENGVLKKYIGEEYGVTDVVIPGEVTSIGDGAFGDEDLNDWYYAIDDSDIGDDALRNYDYDYYHIKVTIPNSVTSIDDGAFRDCKSLIEIKIPDSVTSIGDSAFSSCGSLTSVTIPASVTSIGDSAFCECSRLNSVTIPASVTSIGDSAFYECLSLTSVTIPDSVISIGKKTFENCEDLTLVTIGNSVTSIGDWAFSWCSSLTSVTIPESVTSIGDSAFEYCPSLTSINVSEENKTYCDINGVLFNKNKTKLIQYPAGKSDSEYTIPDTVTSLGKNAFFCCHSLTSVTIKGVTFKPDVKKLSKDYKKAIEMLETKDFSAKVYTSLKNAMIIGHFIKTGDEDAEAFIKKGCLRIFKWLIDEEDIPTIYALLNTHKFVTAKNIDKIFEHANQTNNAELKLIFMNYKHEHIGMTKKKELKI